MMPGEPIILKLEKIRHMRIANIGYERERDRQTETESDEAVNHLIKECSKLVDKKYKSRNNKMEKVIR